MARADGSQNVSGKGSPLNTAHFPTQNVPLHRLAEVRRREGVSLHTVARRLGTCTTQVKLQELETTDLPLSILYKWQEVLAIPVSELLIEPDDDLSRPLMKRAQMVRLMKTAMSILEQTKQVSIRRMAQTLVNQLIEIMPELREIGSWHLVGKRRRSDEYGRAADLSLPDDVLIQRPQ